MIKKITKIALLLIVLLFVYGCPSTAIKEFTATKQNLSDIQKDEKYSCKKEDIIVAEKLYQEAEELLKEGKESEAKESAEAADVLIQKIKDEGCPIEEKKDGETIETVTFEDKEIKTEVIGDSVLVDEDKDYNAEAIYFPFNSYKITDEAKETLLKHLDYFSQHENIKIVFEGHTDNRGSEEYNLSLGSKRGSVVLQFFIDQGVSKDRMEVVSYGEEMPIDTSETEEGYSKNRRVSFKLIKITSK
ncbi:OmpA family protein [bacterium]|nr:OmpA family protein [bacterium]